MAYGNVRGIAVREHPWLVRVVHRPTSVHTDKMTKWRPSCMYLCTIGRVRIVHTSTLTCDYSTERRKNYLVARSTPSLRSVFGWFTVSFLCPCCGRCYWAGWVERVAGGFAWFAWPALHAWYSMGPVLQATVPHFVSGLYRMHPCLPFPDISLGIGSNNLRTCCDEFVYADEKKSDK